MNLLGGSGESNGFGRLVGLVFEYSNIFVTNIMLTFVCIDIFEIIWIC